MVTNCNLFYQWKYHFKLEMLKSFGKSPALCHKILEFSLKNRKIDLIEGNYPGEPFGDADHFNDRRLLSIRHHLESYKN